MNPYALLVALLGLVGAFAGGWWTGARVEQGTQKRAEDAAEAARAAAMQGAAEAIAKIEVRHTTIRQPLEREIRENTVYRDCRHSPDALRLLNDALTDRDPQPAGGGGVPAVDAPR